VSNPLIENTLPYWLFVTLELLKGVTILVFGGLGAWIAFRQYALAQNKLKLDLYDKRYAVYENIRKVLATLVREGAENALVGYRLVHEFDIGTADASFLFDDEIVVYISTTRKDLVDLSFVSQQNKREGEKLGGKQDIEKEYKLYNKLVEDFNGHPSRFKKYLSFS
jgi:hypothetical protein